MNHLSDEELMAHCALGSRCAMDVLVTRYHGKLLDFAFRHLRDRETAADIAQTTLITVFERAASYQATASFKTWLYTIALNRVRDDYRKRKTRRELLSSQIEDTENVIEIAVDSNQSPENAIFDKVNASLVWDAIDELQENYKSALILRFRHELTYEEVAVVMGTSSGTVKSWIHYALKKLRKSPDLQSED